MRCPACKNLMIVVEHNRIELDYCVECAGVWFDAGELEVLIETMQLEQSSLSLDSILSTPETKSTEKKRQCPICAKKMKKATLGHAPEVLIDVCPRGDGLWFDKGEVGQLITQLPDNPSTKPQSQERVINFLGEVFNHGMDPNP
ncbi:MAG: zf-TFIIB domain-containing protein [Dehalococcoidia bacterium]|nr:zf-TFIIB domain-containing protein [Dehalococcoidia bacterium]